MPKFIYKEILKIADSYSQVQHDFETGAYPKCFLWMLALQGGVYHRPRPYPSTASGGD
jgi:hypothetical protein